MRLTIDEKLYLEQRKEEIQQELHSLLRWEHGPSYYDVDSRRLELLDELDRVETELEESHAE